MPYPKEDLPSYLKEFVGYGDSVIKDNLYSIPTDMVSLINDFNFSLCRLWTYAMINNECMCWIDPTDDGFDFIAYKIEDGKEFTSVVPLPDIPFNVIEETIVPTLAEKYNAVFDPNMIGMVWRFLCEH